jgi:hypothetical protein
LRAHVVLRPGADGEQKKRAREKGSHYRDIAEASYQDIA